MIRLLLIAALAGAAGAAGAQADALERAARETGAVRTDSGLVYRSLKDGTGAQPGAADTVRVHYRGTFPDGKEFDSSYLSLIHI
jgi:FKBP-type peptidyl-prolyl cis-trans isomerase FkpA